MTSSYVVLNNRSNENMLDILQWVAHGINFKWASEILNTNEFPGLKFECEPENGRYANYGSVNPIRLTTLRKNCVLLTV